jgi:hypothetical protein
LDANYVSDRIASLSDERSGNVLQVESSASSNGAWVLNRAAPNDSTPNIIIARTQPATEAAIAGRIENDVFFRVLASNNFNSARVEAWDLRTGLRLASLPLNAPLVSNVGTAPNSLRPEISYSPARNTLYVVSAQFGTLWAINIGTGVAQKILLPAGNFGVRDVEIDSSRDVAYLVMRATFSGPTSENNEAIAPGRLYELNLASNIVTRQIGVGIGPWQLAMAPVSGFMNVFLTNAADEPNNENADSISQINVNTFQLVRKLTTLNQPTAISMQLLD